MLFHEIYGLYYQTVAKIIDAALEERLSLRELRRIASETGFSETVMNVEAAFQSEQWPLVDMEGFTPLMTSPERPMTLLERRWLKAISLDPRIRLFGDFDFDDDVPPLFCPEDIAIYDRYGDGDPFETPEYQKIFGTILAALRERRSVEIIYFTQRDAKISMNCCPWRLEYSSKDDKFRLIACGKNGGSRINLGRVASAKLGEKMEGEQVEPERYRREYILKIEDKRNALERAMLHFADLEKRTERLEENKYQMTIRYDAQDETELVIRVLSFGPMLKAVEPKAFVDQIRHRIECQRALMKGENGK